MAVMHHPCTSILGASKYQIYQFFILVIRTDRGILGKEIPPGLLWPVAAAAAAETELSIPVECAFVCSNNRCSCSQKSTTVLVVLC